MNERAQSRTLWKLISQIGMVGLWLVGFRAMHAEASSVRELPCYRPVEIVSGTVGSVGSDSLSNLMSFWSEEFRAIYPHVIVQVEGKGSATAPPALIEGTAQLGPMSRLMKADEIDAFEHVHGYKPLAIPVAIDAISLFVHKDNPVAALSVEQIDAVFSDTRKLAAAATHTWAQLGVSAWSHRTISLYGRNSASGTYGFFQEFALGGGDFKSSVKEQPGSSAVLQALSADLYGIGYSSAGYENSGVRIVPILRADGAVVAPTYQAILSGDYPFARLMVIYVNKHPDRPLDLVTFEFLRFVLSAQGQRMVLQDGYFPLPADLVSRTLEKIDR